MPRPSKRSPKKLELMRAARAAGKGLRDAAKATGVSHETLRTWEKRDHARRGKTNGNNSIPPTSAQESSGVAVGDAAEAASMIGALPAGTPLAEINARRSTVLRMLAQLEPAVERDERPMTSYISLARYGDELALRAAELTPPDPGDPETHPENVDAAQRVMDRILSAVQEARARARCVHCGRNPHA